MAYGWLTGLKPTAHERRLLSILDSARLAALEDQRDVNRANPKGK